MSLAAVPLSSTPYREPAVIETEAAVEPAAVPQTDAADPLSGVALYWAPVVSRESRPTGFRLRMRGRARGASLGALLNAVLAGFGEEAGGVPHGLVILAPSDLPPDDSLAHWGAPRNVLLEVDERVLTVPEEYARLTRAQSHGARLALNVQGPQWPAAHRLAPFQYLIGEVSMLARAATRSRNGCAASFAFGESVLASDRTSLRRPSLSAFSMRAPIASAERSVSERSVRRTRTTDLAPAISWPMSSA